MAISTNEIKIKYVIDDTELRKATTSFDNLNKEEQDAINSMKKLNNELKNTGKEANDAGGKLKGAFSQAQGGVDNFQKGLGGIGNLIAGAFTVTAVVGFAKAVFNTTAEFQKLGAVLKNTLGSGAQASLALENIKEFAKTTPFSVQELTASFVKLANQGFTPTVAQMKRLGDLASSTGKSFDQLTEAIIDAQVGEFERLKEFGIRASKAGDQVTFTFKGVQTQTNFTNEAIREYITSLGDYAGVAGSAEAVSATLGGKVNNLGDAWDNFLNKIGTLLGPVLQGALEVTSDFMNDINTLFGNAKSKAESYSERELETYKDFQKQMVTMTSDELDAFVIRQNKRLSQTQSDLVKYSKEANKYGSSIRKAAELGFGQESVVNAVKEIEIANQSIAGIKGAIAAAEEQIKLRADNTLKTEKLKQQYAEQAKKDAEEQAKADKKIYEKRLKQYELEKQILSLQAQLRGSKIKEFEAEKVFAEQVYNLKKKYSNKNIGITKNEVKAAELSAQVKAQAYENALQKEKLANKEAKFQIVNDDKNQYDTRLAQMKQWQKAYEQGLADEVKAKKMAEEEKQAIIQSSFQLGQTLMDGGFQLYQANLNNEMALLQKRYEQDIMLADGNQQKIDEINQRKAQKEKELKEKAFKAERAAAIARVIFETASIVAKWASQPTTIPLAALTLFNQAAQIGFILAQPVPEFAEGTKGKPFKGGKAIVGERGVEKVVTESGKVYFTPPTATLVDLPRGSQVIPNHSLSRQELFLSSHYAGKSSTANPMIGELREIGSLLKSMPITQVSMDERGFEKFIRTPRRTTKILNNRFRSDSL